MTSRVPTFPDVKSMVDVVDTSSKDSVTNLTKRVENLESLGSGGEKSMVLFANSRGTSYASLQSMVTQYYESPTGDQAGYLAFRGVLYDTTNGAVVSPSSPGGFITFAEAGYYAIEYNVNVAPGDSQQYCTFSLSYAEAKDSENSSSGAYFNPWEVVGQRHFVPYLLGQTSQSEAIRMMRVQSALWIRTGDDLNPNVGSTIRSLMYASAGTNIRIYANVFKFNNAPLSKPLFYYDQVSGLSAKQKRETMIGHMLRIRKVG